MATPVIMPKFEMAQETGTIAHWLKQDGEAVKKGEPLLEVETDKVVMEVEAPADGVLRGIRAAPGEVVPIGQPIAYLVAVGETWPQPGGGQPAAADDSLPVAPTETTGEASAVDAVDQAPRATPVARRMAQVHQVDLGAVAAGRETRVTKRDVRAYLDHQAGGPPGRVRAVPAARRLARTEGVDLAQVDGTGPEGRVQSDDVRRASARLTASPAGAGHPADQGLAVRRRYRLNSVRQVVARRMTASFQEVPQFALSVDVAMDRALEILRDLNDAAGDADRVTVTAFLLGACARALALHPEINASYEQNEIVEWEDINLGVAVAASDGLVVPVIHRANLLGLRALSRKLGERVTAARERRLRPDDLRGGTFTVSNLGMFSVDHFTAIVNPPQAAILAVGRVRKEAVVNDADQVQVVQRANFTLSADHRVFDGALAAVFLTTLKQLIERPGLFLE
jgi:pyruvate dehydrogenase E2 component (dihydrolipoamide acetyltransferase)